MFMLKSYDQFINENILEPIDDGLSYFIEELISERNSKNTLLQSYLNSSFSTYGKNYMEENIYNGLEQFANDAIIKLNDKYCEKAVKKYIDYIIINGMTDSYGIENGISDIIFHKYNSNFPLGSNNIHDDSDAFVRYVYGWHLSHYGKMAMLQEFESLKEFTAFAIKRLDNYLDFRLSSDEFVVEKSLVLIYDDDTFNDKELFNFITHYKSDDFKIIEILNSDNEEITNIEDWYKFYLKVNENVTGSYKIDWMEISKGKLTRNHLKSGKAINKFKL